MYVVKRDGRKENIYFDKIVVRLSNLLTEKQKNSICIESVAQKTIETIYSGISSEEIDIQSSKICNNLTTTHINYNILGSRILVSNLHKKTLNSFVEKELLIQSKLNILNEDWIKWISENKEILESNIDYQKDYNFDFFGFKTLESGYLLKIEDKIIERPQDMLMRVASFINKGDIDNTIKTYKLLSDGYYIHASPTLFNCGCKMSQLASCFLLNVDDDLKNICKSWNDISSISKHGGGIGFTISNIRSKGSAIKSTNGKSDGIIPLIKVYDSIAAYVNQSGKRKGAVAVYIEPHHPEILSFLDLRKNNGVETERARNLFYAVWIPDLFMKQVEKDDDWYLFCPSKCPLLTKTYGDEYENLYWKYVEEKLYEKVVKARDIMNAIVSSKIETGTPYICYKDHINKKSNQINLGTIQNSNLCAEITEYSSSDEYAVCNLASVSLPKFVIPFEQKYKFIIYTKENCKYCKWAKTFLINTNLEFEEKSSSKEELSKLINKLEFTYPCIFYGEEYIGGFNDMYLFIKGTFDYEKLYEVAYMSVVNLNKTIDVNYYSIIETKRSNLKHRPVAVGIQGLADTLFKLKINFESEESVDFNSKIMETIYLGALNASCDIAEYRCKKLNNFSFDIPEYYDNSFIIENKELNDIYHELKLNKFELNTDYPGAYSTFKGSPFSEGKFQFDLWGLDRSELFHKDRWFELEKRIVTYGTRNSLVTALMPTATTGQILGNNECFEPYVNNIYIRKTLAGEFPIINKSMVEDLCNLDLWNAKLKNLILLNNGSISEFNNIPQVLKNLYKTTWEMKQIWLLQCSKARGPFVDQTQSLNIFMDEPNNQKLYSSFFWAWKNGLKTASYYLRSKPSVGAKKITVVDKKDECTSCSG